MTKILLVDDEPDILKMLGLRLKKTGYDVITAIDGEEALDCLAHEKPNLILLDVHLPKLKGDELAERLKRDNNFKHIPIVFITADARIQSDYADEYLVKPFDSSEMIRKIEQCLAKTN